MNDIELKNFVEKIKPMDKQTEISQLKIALNLQGVYVTERVLDQTFRTVQMLKEKGGEFNIKDALIISEQVKKEYEENE